MSSSQHATSVCSVAAVQMTSGTDTDANLRAAAEALARAAEGGAELAVLPENFAGYGVDYRALGERYGELCGWLMEQARSLGLWVIGGSIPALTRPGGEPVPAPLAGNIFEVLVKPGQRVEEGERVLVLEAMKMETDVAAPRAGTVAEVRVKPGDAVAVGDVLLTIGG